MLLTLMLDQKYLLIFANQDRTQIFLTESIKQRLSEIHKLGSASSVPLSSGKQAGWNCLLIEHVERFINLYIHLGLQSYSEKGSGPVRKGVKSEKKTLALISSTWKHKDL